MPHRARSIGQRRLFASLLTLALLSVVCPAQADHPSDVPRLDAEQRRRLVSLKGELSSDDAAARRGALREAEGWGEAGVDPLRDVLADVLARDERTIRTAVRRAGDPQRLAQMFAVLEAEREKALAHIAKLTKSAEDLQRAWENRDKLEAATATINKPLAVRSALLDAVMRRADLLPAYRDLLRQGETDRFPEAEEAALMTEAEEALGFDLALARRFPGLDARPPSDPAAKPLWLYRGARHMDAWNQRLASLMNQQEMINLTLVNTYREALGILPYEADPRLIQSARLHSKEMVELGYFSHTSPTEANKTHTKRMKNRGYDGGHSENIAAGNGSGEAVFKQWFDSPGHHRNMVAAQSVAMGVGQWGNHWTQNMGRGPRLSLAGDEALREAVEAEGGVEPQGRRAR